MFVAGNPPLLWQLVGEREELQLLQQTLPSEHPAQTQEWEEAGAGLGRLPCSLKPHFCVCVCVLELLQEGREWGSWSLWDVSVGDPSSLCPWDVIPWAFHTCPREQRGQRMLQNAQKSVIWGGSVVSHLLQWKMG